MVDPARARKLAKRIGTIVATAIDHEIKDPRLAFVTITDTKVTNDLHDATVYYTVMGEKVDSAPDVEAAAETFFGARAPGLTPNSQQHMLLDPAEELDPVEDLDLPADDKGAVVESWRPAVQVCRLLCGCSGVTEIPLRPSSKY